MDFLKSNTFKFAFKISISRLCLLVEYSFVHFSTGICAFSVPTTETPCSQASRPGRHQTSRVRRSQETPIQILKFHSTSQASLCYVELCETLYIVSLNKINMALAIREHYRNG